MAKVLGEYFGEVQAFDAYQYGYGEVRDFLTHDYEANSFDWVITNPPFRLAQEFVHKAFKIARAGVAVLTRTVFIESVARHERLFKPLPPTKFVQYAERVPMVRGRLDRNASSATAYSWLVWEKTVIEPVPRLVWIPPSRRRFERDEDYEETAVAMDS